MEGCFWKVGQNRFWLWQKYYYHVLCWLRTSNYNEVLNLNKISQRTWQKIGYFNSWQFPPPPTIIQTLWKQPRMCALDSRSSKSCGNPLRMISASPLGSILKQIPTAIFTGILPKLKHWCKRHCLLFYAIDISMLPWQRDLKCRCWIGPSNKMV